MDKNLRRLLEDTTASGDSDVLPQNVSAKCSGKDDTTNIPVGISDLIFASRHSTLQSIATEKTRVLAADHNQKSEKQCHVLQASSTLDVLGECLFSGSTHGKETHYTTSHCTISRNQLCLRVRNGSNSNNAILIAS